MQQPVKHGQLPCKVLQIEHAGELVCLGRAEGAAARHQQVRNSVADATHLHTTSTSVNSASSLPLPTGAVAYVLQPKSTAKVQATWQARASDYILEMTLCPTCRSCLISPSPSSAALSRRAAEAHKCGAGNLLPKKWTQLRKHFRHLQSLFKGPKWQTEGLREERRKVTCTRWMQRSIAKVASVDALP
eukprot:SM000056S17943  [mRNA]  locus=s56:250659:252482:+ [translate_table: standard]